MLPVPLQCLLHPLLRETVADKLRLVDRSLAEPMPSPPIALIRVRRILKSIAAQRVQHIALDRLGGRRIIRDEVVRLRVQAQDNHVRDESGNTRIRIIRLEYLLVDPGEIILVETANGIRRAQHCLANPVLVERHQSPVAPLHLDDAVLDGHKISWTESYHIPCPSTITLTHPHPFCYLRLQAGSVRDNHRRQAMEKLSKCIAEAIGTFALIFIGIGAIYASNQHHMDLLGVALAHGLTIAVMVSATGHISGGHLNPAVTLGALVGGKIDLKGAISYWASQLVGATVAAFVCLMLFSREVVVAGTPQLGGGTSAMAGIVIEAITTFFLVFVVYGTAIDPRAPKIGGLAIGLTIALDILFAGP